MRRAILFIVLLTSCALIAFLAALWVRSFWYVDALWFEGVTRRGWSLSYRSQLTLGSNSVGFGERRIEYHEFATSYVDSDWPIRSPGATAHDALGFGVSLSDRPIGNDFYWEVRIPKWLPMLTAALVAWVSGKRLRRLRRWAEGCCLTCGYDLRASTDRCPECGTAIPPSAVRVP